MITWQQDVYDVDKTRTTIQLEACINVVFTILIQAYLNDANKMVAPNLFLANILPSRGGIIFFLPSLDPATLNKIIEIFNWLHLVSVPSHM
jgi:hypothetical protein